MRSEIVIPNRVQAIEPAVEFVRSWGLKVGLPPQKANELALCADEVITDVVSTLILSVQNFIDTAEIVVKIFDRISKKRKG